MSGKIPDIQEKFSNFRIFVLKFKSYYIIKLNVPQPPRAGPDYNVKYRFLVYKQIVTHRLNQF